MKTLETKLLNGKPVFSWASEIEDGAMKQIEGICKLPYVEHLAIMPDVHLGMSCPIGGVVACKNVIVPDFVGVDISCGMAAFRTNRLGEVFVCSVCAHTENADINAAKNILNRFVTGKYGSCYRPKNQAVLACPELSSL